MWPAQSLGSVHGHSSVLTSESACKQKAWAQGILRHVTACCTIIALAGQNNVGVVHGFPKCFHVFFHGFPMFPRCFSYFCQSFPWFVHAFSAGKMADETETADMRGKAIRVHLGVEGQSVRVGLRGSSSCHDYTSSTAQGDGGSFQNRKPIGAVGSCESRMAERSH